MQITIYFISTLYFQEEVENQNKDEKEEKSRKRTLEEFLTRDQNPESEEQNEPQQSKKKKQKKDKKSKEQRESNKTSEPDVPLNIVSNDDNETIKKKKDKKAKKEEKMDEESEETVENACIFKKDFYSVSYSSFPHEDKEKEKSDAEQYRKDHRITMYGKGKSKGQFHPIRDFNKLGFEENMLGAVKNFKEPTPIQAKPSLKIRTANSIFYISLGIFRDYGQKIFFQEYNFFVFQDRKLKLSTSV